MSVARAICTCKTCGCEFEMTAYKRNRAECNSWSKWAKTAYVECDDCREARIKAEREAASKEASEAAKEMGLPELKGSEKQIAWAQTIRLSFVERWQKWVEETRERLEKGRTLRRGITLDAIDMTYKYIVGKTDAHWWIDHRDAVDPLLSGGEWVFSQFHQKAQEAIEMAEVQKELPPPPAPEIIEPEERRSAVVVTIGSDEKTIWAKSKYAPLMPDVVKALGYKWDASERIWSIPNDFKVPSPVDAMAEVANRLLLAGFSVMVPPEVKDKAANGTYEPMSRRWIVWYEDDQKLGIHGDVDPKGIPGYRRGKVGLEAYVEVEEFARTYDYRFSPGASEAIDAYKARITKVDVTAGKGPEYQDRSGEIAAILNSSKDVLEDLVDED